MSSTRRFGVFSRLKTGLTLTRDSLSVLKHHPDLMLFPLAGAVASILFGAVLYLSVFVGGLVGGGLEYIALFVFYFVTTFMASFFTAALVYSVNDAFHGRNPTLRNGMAAAWEMKGPLAIWSVISAIVGVLLNSLENSDSGLARIAGAFFALGWTVTTFFVIPVIVFEDVSTKEMFSKSAGTFRDTWGETLGAGFGIGLVQLGIGLLGAAVVFAIGGGLYVIVPAVGVSIVILGVVSVAVIVYLVGQTIQGITKTALYMYAAEGTVPDEFDNFDFDTLGGRTDKPATPGRVSSSSSTMTSFK